MLNRCLSCVADIVDEIIIVDTGSTDRTKKSLNPLQSSSLILSGLTISRSRNFAFSKATQDYILWLDADDILLEEDQLKLKTLKENLTSGIDSVTMLYHLSSDEFGNVTFSLRRNRLVKRNRGFRWIGPVHEYLEVYGNIINSDIAITHLSSKHDPDTGRNLRIYEKRETAGESFTPRDLFYYANELKDHGQFEKAIDYYEQFLHTEQGWIEDILTACDRLSDCHHELGNGQASFESSIRSLHYAPPRSEFSLPHWLPFFVKNNYDTAIYWYKLATELESPPGYMGFHNPSFSTWCLTCNWPFVTTGSEPMLLPISIMSRRLSIAQVMRRYWRTRNIFKTRRRSFKMTKKGRVHDSQGTQTCSDRQSRTAKA